MTPQILQNISEIFAALGPWACTVVLGWACWRENEHLIRLSRDQTEAITKFYSLLSELKNSIERLTERMSH